MAQEKNKRKKETLAWGLLEEELETVLAVGGKSSNTNLFKVGGQRGNLFKAMAFDNGVLGHSDSAFGHGESRGSSTIGGRGGV